MTSMYWTEAEDNLLLSLVEKDGPDGWQDKADKLGTKRSLEAVYKHYKVIVTTRGLTEGNFGLPPKAPPRRRHKDSGAGDAADRKALAATTMDAAELAQHREQCKQLIAPWEELARGLRAFFNAALAPFLLFEAEREQVAEVGRVYADVECKNTSNPRHTLISRDVL